MEQYKYTAQELFNKRDVWNEQLAWLIKDTKTENKTKDQQYYRFYHQPKIQSTHLTMWVLKHPTKSDI